jgi:hypothetical protein
MTQGMPLAVPVSEQYHALHAALAAEAAAQGRFWAMHDNIFHH